MQTAYTQWTVALPRLRLLRLVVEEVQEEMILIDVDEKKIERLNENARGNESVNEEEDTEIEVIEGEGITRMMKSIITRRGAGGTRGAGRGAGIGEEIGGGAVRRQLTTMMRPQEVVGTIDARGGEMMGTMITGSFALSFCKPDTLELTWFLFLCSRSRHRRSPSYDEYSRRASPPRRGAKSPSPGSVCILLFYVWGPSILTAL